MAKKMILKSYDEINADRKRLRRIFVIASIPFILIIALFAYKATTMYVNAGSAISSYDSEKYTDSIVWAEKQKTTNFLEQWLAHYNLGTAQGKSGNWDGAVKELNKALTLAGNEVPTTCFIRANLAIAYEKVGDNFTREGDEASAKKQYWQASTLVEETPQDCFPPDQGGTAEENSDEAEAGESLTETKERTDEKQAGEENPDGEPSEGDEPEEAEDGEKGEREKIQDQLDQSGKDRADSENSEEGESSTEPYDKPW